MTNDRPDKQHEHPTDAGTKADAARNERLDIPQSTRAAGSMPGHKGRDALLEVHLDTNFTYVNEPDDVNVLVARADAHAAPPNTVLTTSTFDRR